MKLIKYSLGSRPICVLAFFLVWLGTFLSAQAPYKIILKSGTVIQAKTKMVSMEGFFRFTDLDNRFRSIPVDQVDLHATEEANAGDHPKTDITRPVQKRFTNDNLPAGIDLFPESPGPRGSSQGGATGQASNLVGKPTGSSAGLTGSSGVEPYDQALRDHLRTGKPLAVYFYVHWCPYCVQLDKEILTSPVVRQYLDQVLYVSINAEAGEKEMALFKRLGGTGYPHFAIISNHSGQIQRVSAHFREKGQWVLRPPSAFVEACRNAGG
jgi:thiol-disulfide isomerase/thioredoxin